MSMWNHSSISKFIHIYNACNYYYIHILMYAIYIIYLYIHNTEVYIYIYMYVCIYVYTYICVYICMYIYNMFVYDIQSLVNLYIIFLCM